jgi:hypothetical protein
VKNQGKLNFEEEIPVQMFIQSISTLKGKLLIRVFLTCLLLWAFSVASIPTHASPAEDKAKKAFADWKDAQEAVNKAKRDLAAKQKKLQGLMSDKFESGKKKKKKEQPAPEDPALAKARQDVADAEDALAKAEAALLAARIALEKAIAELPEESEVKKELKRLRDALTNQGGDRVIGAVAPPNSDQVTTVTQSTDGMRVVNFDVPQGHVIVNLPDDMRAGDTISGTVVTEPKGSTDQERSRNTAELNGYVVELNSPKPQNDGDKKPPANVMVILDAAQSNEFKIYLPDNKTGQKLLDVNLRQLAGAGNSTPGASNFVPVKEDERLLGKVIATSTLPYSNFLPPTDFNVFYTSSNFNIPKIAQQGRSLEIIGPFDGNFSNTTLKISVQDFEKKPENVSGGLRPIAESPRKAVFRNPSDVTGPIELTLNEGNRETKGTVRNVGVNLSAPKTNLLKGEKTELKVEVSGLQGIKEAVPLTLESKGVITMEGGPYQPLVIQPSQVSADGRYSTTREITGVQAGGWGATATVVTNQFDVCLQDDSNPAAVVLWNTFTGDYNFRPITARVRVDFKGTWSRALDSSDAGAQPPQVMRNGCMITLTHNAPGARVMATFDGCAKTGNATVEVGQNKQTFTITDRNTTDNSCAAH